MLKEILISLLSILSLLSSSLSNIQPAEKPIGGLGGAISPSINMFDGKATSTLNFPYTDENVGESFLIYTDRETYNELSTFPVKIAVVNNSGKAQNMTLQVYLKNSDRQVTSIEQLKLDIPYQVKIDDFSTIQTCKDVFHEFTKATTTSCYFPKIGEHQETRYKDEWQTITTKNAIERPIFATKSIDIPYQTRIEDFDTKETCKDIFDGKSTTTSCYFDKIGEHLETKYIKTVSDKGLTVPIGIGETLYFTANIKIDPNIGQEEFFIEAYGDQGGYGSLDPWFNSNWRFRQKITINSDDVWGNETNFPVLATTTQNALRAYPNGGNVASSTGGDILFTDSDHNKIPHEIERYTASSGELIAWINVPNISSTTNVHLFMYYGNSAATYQPQPTRVWDSNYAGVWHLGDGTTLNANDSTSNANNGTVTGSVPATTGKVGGGTSWSNDAANRIERSAAVVSSEPATISGWMRLANTAAGEKTLVAIAAPSTDCDLLDVDVDSSNAQAITGEGCSYSVGTKSGIVANSWHYVVGVFPSSSSRIAYVDGVAGATSTVSRVVTGLNRTTIGDFYNASSDTYGNPMNGLIDEVRISNISRSNNWIRTEYNNVNAMQSFLSFGSEEGEPKGLETFLWSTF